MAVQLSYPGVYVDERPSGVRTITGVATSITAFVGRAPRGPVNKAQTVTSYADFERIYGGLWLDSTLGYAVRDFYQQGGTIAVIVRVHKAAADDVATFSVGAAPALLELRASSPGAWGARLTATVDRDLGPNAAADLFNLTVADPGRKTEVFRNVSFLPASPRRVDIVVANESTLVEVVAPLPAGPPANAPATGAVTDGSGNDGADVDADDYTTGTDFRLNKLGLYALEDVDLVNLVVVPPYTDDGEVQSAVLSDAIAYAHERRAFVILDPPKSFTTVEATTTAVNAITTSRDAAVYYPRIRKPDPLRDNQLATFAPAGAIAGVIARTDATRGVWKAPAGLDARVDGVSELSVPLTDLEIGRLNPLGVNCLRFAPGAGHVVWGARTRDGNDRNASEWKYVPVRRTALFLEESLYRGTQWVVFEPNDAPLWAQIRLNVGAFMNNLFRQGAFAGTTPKEAYFVKCDAETTTQDDVNLGVVNIIVGFAPLKPAEFVVITLQQLAGQTGSA
jgi:phage tail sheath protein FI